MVRCLGCEQAARPGSKWCTDACRQAYNKATSRGSITALPTPGSVTDGPCAVATERDLTAANRLDTPYGAAAMALARRIDMAADHGAGMASLAKQLQATLTAALAGAESPAVSRLEQIRAQRDQKRA